jgi:S1-C subfamily serine protease
MTVPVVVGAMPLAARGQLAGERFGFLVREAEETAAGRPPAPTRVFIAFVDPDSPAARAGLQPQDAVLRVNDEPVRDLEGFANALWRTTEAPVLIVERRGAPAPVVVKLELPR